MKKVAKIIFTIVTILVLFAGFLFSKSIYEDFFLLGSSDFQQSKMVYEENKCENCEHSFEYYISTGGVYIHYNTIVYGEGWKYYSRVSPIGKELVSRLEGVSRKQQVENMKDFSYETLGLSYVSRGAWR